MAESDNTDRTDNTDNSAGGPTQGDERKRTGRLRYAGDVSPSYRRPMFPFSALVGQPRLKAALLANAVDPSIGGLLIRGEKGTGKTTIVRALAELLPPLAAVKGCPFHCDPHNPDTPHDECREKILRAASQSGLLETDTISVPLVELPLNATEERVAGTIHLEETLRTGARHFEPGLLAAANRGILYIDEVNLLEDHLVDLILDAAATGVHRVEREGFSLEHPADFLLVGTMNPEEGELRPQFIDRFGLCISVKGEQEAGVRKEIARRRIAFERDPRQFANRWTEEQLQLSETVTAARALLPKVLLNENLWDVIVDYAARGGVQGHRADIVMAKTAKALTALNRRTDVRLEDVQEAARLSLPHRLSGSIDETPESSNDRLEELIAGHNLPDLETESEHPQPKQAKSEHAEPDENKGFTGAPSFEQPSAFEGRAERTVDPLEELQVPGSAAAGSVVFDFLKKKKPSIEEAEEAEALEQIDVAPRELRIIPRGWSTAQSKKQRSRKRRGGRQGKTVSSRAPRPGERIHDVDWTSTLRNSLLRRGRRQGPGKIVTPDDLRTKVRRSTEKIFVLFLVDASDSMGARRRLAVVKASVLALLQRAYQQRHKVAVVAFGGRKARLLLRPTASVSLARRALFQLRPEGATPMSDAIVRALQILHEVGSRGAAGSKIVVLLSDGEANVPHQKGADPYNEVCSLLPRLKQQSDEVVCIDTKTPAPGRPSEMRRFAEITGGRYYGPESLSAGSVLTAVGRAEAEGGVQ